MNGGAWNIGANPIVVKSARARLRWRHALSWGLVVLTLTGFVTVTNYLTAVRQELATPAEAARMTLLPIIIIQAVILMLLGTGSVASGVSLERDRGLLDYQRMTPMTPTAKIVGYLFGLPVREYFLFALTLPFAAFGIVRGEMSLLTTAHFYAIFFSSVLVYHMTGLVAGMASEKPRRAGLIAQGLVVVLYFVLPNLSRLGLTFFEFLTIRPALFGLIMEEAERMGGEAGVEAVRQFTSLDSFRDIPFYAFHLHPSVYTAIVQGSLIVTMWCVVFRKWRDDHAHPFSKLIGLAFFAGAAAFLLGSVWPILRDDTIFTQLLSQFTRQATFNGELVIQPGQIANVAALMLFASSLVLGAAGLFVIHSTTPTRHKVAEGWRRVVREGGARMPWNRDAASSVFVTAMCAAIAGSVLMYVAIDAARNGRFPSSPSLVATLAPAVYIAAVLLFLQGALERFGRRVFYVSVFMLWVVPFFVSALLIGAFEESVAAAYVAMVCPPFGLFFYMMNILESASEYGLWSNLPEDVVNNMPGLVATGIVVYVALGAIVVTASRRQYAALRAAAISAGGRSTGD